MGVVGCVGRDYFGRFIIDTLGDAGVDVRDVLQLRGVETSGTIILNVAGEDRRFIHTLGANAARLFNLKDPYAARAAAE